MTETSRTDLFDAEPVPVSEMIAEAERELHMRRSVYPRRVCVGKMTQAKADRAITVQIAIIETLRTLADDGNGARG